MPINAERFACLACGADGEFMACTSCRFTQLKPKKTIGSKSWICPTCRANNNSRHRSSAGWFHHDVAWFEYLQKHQDANLVTDCTVTGGHGFDLNHQSQVALLISPDLLLVKQLINSVAIRIPIEDVSYLEFRGNGYSESNAGMVGGGIGFTGAVLGIAAAAAVNSATKKTHLDCWITIKTVGGDIYLQSNHWTPAQLINACSATLARLDQQAATQALEPDPTVQLMNLQQLLDLGTISPEEFETSRRLLVSRLTNGQ